MTNVRVDFMTNALDVFGARFERNGAQALETQRCMRRGAI
jgi:hypothetical protein